MISRYRCRRDAEGFQDLKSKVYFGALVVALRRGVNRGMQIRRSVVFLGPIRRSDLIFVQIRIRVTLKSFRGI